MISISPGHFGIGTGAKGYIDEFSEALKVSRRVHEILADAGVQSHLIVDQVSKSQRENLAYLVREHNKTRRELDVSIHFNATNGLTERPIGVEVLYVNPNYAKLANAVSAAVAQSGGLIDRGAKRRTDLAILNGTHKPCLLVEVCFVNSKADVMLYEKHFEAICLALASELAAQVGVDLKKRIGNLNNNEAITNLSIHFTFSALAERLQVYYHDIDYVEQMLKEGIAKAVFQPVWYDLWEKDKLTFADFCGLCALILCNKK